MVSEESSEEEEPAPKGKRKRPKVSVEYEMETEPSTSKQKISTWDSLDSFLTNWLSIVSWTVLVWLAGNVGIGERTSQIIESNLQCKVTRLMQVFFCHKSFDRYINKDYNTHSLCPWIKNNPSEILALVGSSSFLGSPSFKVKIS